MVEELKLTPEQKRREFLDKEAARKRAATKRKREEALAALSDTERKTEIEAQWARNLENLGVRKREELNNRVKDWNHVYLSMIEVCRQCRQNARYGDGFYPEQVVAEVQKFAEKYPPTEGLEPFHFPPERLAAEPLYFREYGIPIDSIDRVALDDFLYCFGLWYAANRNSLTLEADPNFPEDFRTWDQVDELYAQLKSLAGRKQ